MVIPINQVNPMFCLLNTSYNKIIAGFVKRVDLKIRRNPITSIMAGQNHNEESQKDITNNGIEPVNQEEDQNISEEYDVLDSRLDELNTALDFLEQKNDSIQDQLKELLQSNIEIRQEMQKGNTSAPTNN